MNVCDVDLRAATRVDFTGDLPGSNRYGAFEDGVISLIRKSAGLVVVVDRGYGFKQEAVHLVRDHLNLTGCNPLIGPNDSCGERFPSVNNVYVTDALPGFPRGIAAGLKANLVPSPQELEFMRSLGVDFYCYNLVPAMIVAAHAGLRVLGIVVPEGMKLDAATVKTLTGESA